MSKANGAVERTEIVTQEDLDWWLALAPTLEWTWAKTYADSAPHNYVVLGRTKGIEREDFIRAGRVIRTFGQPGKFYSNLNIYLVSPDGTTKWWTMDEAVTDTDLINMATTEVDYGRQDAPKTDTGTFTLYDSLATVYDKMWTTPEDEAENLAVRRLVVEHFGPFAPKTLDIGCGTGLLLDLGITAPGLFTGVDPSRGMLNELVRKWPKVTKVIPSTMESAYEEVSRDRFDLITAMFSVASYLEPETIAKLPSLLKPGGMVFLMTYKDGYRPDYYEVDSKGPTTREAAQEACRALPLSVPEFSIGEFNCYVVKP